MTFVISSPLLKRIMISDKWTNATDIENLMATTWAGDTPMHRAAVCSRGEEKTGGSEHRLHRRELQYWQLETDTAHKM